MAILKFQNVLNKFLLLVICVAVSGCGGSVDKQLYKVTMTVEVAGKEYSGSSVQEFIHRKCAPNTSSICADHDEIRGEAVAVDIGGRGYLFLTFDGGKLPYIWNIYNNQPVPPKVDKWLVAQSNISSLVKFADINNPLTVSKFDISAMKEEFGSDVSFKKLSVEKTNDEVTFGEIVRIIPWISRMDNKLLLDGNTATSSNLYSNNIHVFDFISGEK